MSSNRISPKPREDCGKSIRNKRQPTSGQEKTKPNVEFNESQDEQVGKSTRVYYVTLSAPDSAAVSHQPGKSHHESVIKEKKIPNGTPPHANKGLAVACTTAPIKLCEPCLGRIRQISQTKHNGTAKRTDEEKIPSSEENPETECIRNLLENSPKLILHLVGQIPCIDCDCPLTSQFCNGNKERVKAFEQNLMTCVRKTDAWVFAPSNMKKYLGKVQEKYSSQEDKYIFFFYPEDESTNVFNLLEKHSEANLVLLMLNGENQSYRPTAEAAVDKKKPFIVIKGSGGDADELSTKIHSIQTGDCEKQSKENTQKPPSVSQDGASRSEEAKSRIKDIATSTTVTVFDLVSSLGEKSSLCSAILDAIIKEDEQLPEGREEKKTKKFKCMELALSWECTEQAEHMETSIFQADTLKDLMMEALNQGKVEFVQIFMKCGVNLRKFVTDENITQLCEPESEIFTKLKVPKKEDKRKQKVMYVLSDLLDDICKQKLKGDKGKQKVMYVLSDLLDDICKQKRVEDKRKQEVENVLSDLLDDICKQKPVKEEKKQEDVKVLQDLLDDICKQKPGEDERKQDVVDVLEDLLVDICTQKRVEDKRKQEVKNVLRDLLDDICKQKLKEDERKQKGMDVLSDLLDELCTQKLKEDERKQKVKEVLSDLLKDISKQKLKEDGMKQEVENVLRDLVDDICKQLKEDERKQEVENVLSELLDDICKQKRVEEDERKQDVKNVLRGLLDDICKQKRVEDKRKQEVENVLSDLLDDICKQKKDEKKQEEKILRDLLDDICKQKLKVKRVQEVKNVLQNRLDNIYKKARGCSPCDSSISEDQLESPELFLFLWALLFGKFQLAEFLWKEVQDHLTAALIACVLLRAMRHRVINDIQFEDEVKEMVTYTELFEGLAVKTLNNLYKDSPSKTFKLLAMVQHTKFWAEVTCLEIAESARCRKFIAQEACQNFADHIWRGKDPHKKLSSKKDSEINGSMVLIRIIFFISYVFVAVPKAFMEFSQNKRGPAQLQYAITGFFANWPRSWRAPSFKFYVSWFCFIGFLTLYAYVLMVRIPPKGLQLPEIALVTWFFTLYVEEFRVSWALVINKSQRLKLFLLYQLGFLNATNYYLAMLGIILWVFDADSFALHAVLCLNFISFVVRLFQYLSISSQLGPKVFMIKRMIKEIILFSVILMIIFLTYGVIKYSIDNGGQGVINSTVVLALPVEAFWLMLADRPSDENDIRSDDDPSVIFRGILRVAYLFFTTILLINLLIATFSYVFEVIHNQKDDVRKYQKFQLIVKFSLGSPLPAPLSLVYLFIFFFKPFYTKRQKEQSKETKERKEKKEHEEGPLYGFRRGLVPEKRKSLLNWAKVTTEAYTEDSPKTMEQRVEDTMKKSFLEHDQKEDDKNKDDKNERSLEEIRSLIARTLSIHESLEHNIDEMHYVSTKLAGQRTVCDPCIIYKRCVVCGKLPRYPGAMHYDLIYPRRRQSNEMVPRRKSMPLLRHLSEPGGRH